MEVHLFLFLLLLSLYIVSIGGDGSGFTCQGKSMPGAMANCPDKGVQRASSGGNVTILVKKANNLPNRDYTGPAAGVSDPYVKFIFGDNQVVKSKVVRNNLNPVWNQYVNLGYLTSGTFIQVEIWDYDIGFEFTDDFMVRGNFRVPFCSMFWANTSSVDCGRPFGCEADDSAWKSPSRLLCNETGLVSFINGFGCYENGGSCLELEVHLVPFQMNIEAINPKLVKFTPQMTVLGDSTNNAPWTNNFDLPFLSDTADVLDLRVTDTQYMKGGLMVRQHMQERGKGSTNSIRFYASINFPAYIYVCRDEEDNLNGVPTWITSTYDSSNLTVSRLLIRDTTTYFGCFIKYFVATEKNRYGGVKSNYLSFYTNTIPGHDKKQSVDTIFYNHDYIIIAVPFTMAALDETINITYDSSGFLGTIGSYGIVWAWFLFIVTRFIKKNLNYRIDRVMTWLVSRVLSGDQKSLIAALFLTKNESPSNIDFRAHLFHSVVAIYLFMSLPFFLLIGWGLSCSVLVRPQALGYAIIFVGMSGQLLWFALRLWESSNWRMSPISIVAIAFSVIFFLVYIFSIIFIDPAVILFGEKINFAALSILFGTLNTFPLLLLVFKQDKTYKINLNLVVSKMSDAVFKLKNPLAKITDKKKVMGANKSLHELLGHGYTINPKLPVFKFATVIQEPNLLPQKTQDALAAAGAAAGATGSKGAATSQSSLATSTNIPEDDEDDDGSQNDLYFTSLGILAVYMIIALARTKYPSLAFVHILTLMLLDLIHRTVAAGDMNWSPGFKITLLVIGRLLITGSSPQLWLLNYSLTYLIYAVALMNEIINTFLPMLSLRQASEVAFAGGNESDKPPPSNDIAGTASFTLGILSFAFIVLLLVSAFGGVKEQLPVPPVPVWNAQWNVYVFGLLAILVVINGGLMMATVRAFYLERHNLLRGWARESYMLKRWVKVPMILAIFSEIAVLSSGILIYGATRSSAILILCIFLPIIFATLGSAYREWIKNDYELIIWPPKDSADNTKGDSPSDMEVAFHMIENLFGDEENTNPDDLDDDDDATKTLKGFKLPPLEATATKIDNQIKMPPLPLKSVLRRKRQNLGIKVKNPLVKDLGARDGAEADKFGTGQEVVENNDPWAKYDDDELAVDLLKKKKRKNQFLQSLAMPERGGFANHPLLLKTKENIMAIPALKYAFTRLHEFYTAVSARITAYSKISLNTDEDDDLEKEGEQKEGDDPDKEKDLDVPLSENFSKMPFWTAVIGGYLSWSEYASLLNWFVGMFAIMMMGVTLSKACRPEWLGHTIWVAVWTAILTYIVVVKYFNTFVVDRTMMQIVYFTGFFHFLFCISFFGKALNGDIGLPATLWILDYFIYYPIFLFIGFEFYRWRDEGYKVDSLTDFLSDGSLTVQDYINYFKTYPLTVGVMLIFVWELYLWINYLIGEIATLILLACGIGYFFVRDWAKNDFFLSPELTWVGSSIIQVILFFTFFIGLLSSQNTLFTISLFFFCLIFRSCARIGTRFMIADADTIVFFSPFVMPVYSYDPRNNDIVDEGPIAKEFISLLIMGALWGAFLAAFLYPVDVGITVACIFLLVIAAVISSAISLIPLQLGRLANMLSPDSIVEAAVSAKEKFEERKQPLNLEMSEWDDTADDWTKKAPTQIDKLKEMTSLSLAAEIIDDTRALTYIRDDSDYVASQMNNAMDDDDDEPVWYLKMYKDAIDSVKKLFELIPMGQMAGWKRHSEAFFSLTDAAAEAIIRGRGPLGFLGLEGLWYKLLKQAQQNPRLKFLQQPWINRYDEFGNDTTIVQLSEHMNTDVLLTRFLDLDEALDYAFANETKCAIHFLLMLLVAADSKMQREQVLFQKFLRENRFRLASNGISPPSEIFSSSSFASIDIPLVAVWLSTLTSEERERFYMLKSTFSEEQSSRDAAIDQADYNLALEAIKLKQVRVQREKEVAEIIERELQKRQALKINNFIETLAILEKSRFAQLRDDWLANADCYVDFKDRQLYSKFRAACMNDADEGIEYAREVLGEIEAAQKDCRIGEYGRAYQFVDSEFPPGDTAIGEGDASQYILGWRCAPGISDITQLFDGGTNPDDVHAGIFLDEWLLSAISMLAAADVMEGVVNEQVDNLFVGHYALDGEVTYHTEVGGYCVRIYKHGIWNPIIVDDCFPLLRHENWTNENRGLAGAFSKECTQLWVSLIEKAFAKFLGSYSELSKGFVHHALEDMTGCEAECMSLAHASRGLGKRALWDQLLRFRKNGYILGAGTGSSALADKEIQDMGIVFNAAYSIYEVCVVDGEKLIKLRNPPGDHEEWKGDWSDKSDLWTRRFKGKLGWTDADDNTFFMSFDDFCNVFRNLYVCKWYKPGKWSKVTYPGVWKKAVDPDAGPRGKKKERDMFEGLTEADLLEAKREEEKRCAFLKCDTSGGLPTKHNPGCIIENNPHFTLKIHRPTDIRITVAQADSRGKAAPNVHPFTLMIVKNPHPTTPMRLQSLSKENVVVSLPEPKAERTQHLYATLKPGLYIVLVATYVKELEGNFTVTLLSNYRSEFTPLWPPKWMLHGLKEDPKDAMAQVVDKIVEIGGDDAKRRLAQASDLYKKTKTLLLGGGKGEEEEDNGADSDDDALDDKYQGLKF